MSATTKFSGNESGARMSVWDTLAAMKARHSAAASRQEIQRESLRVRRDALAAVERAFSAAAAEGNTDGSAILARVFADQNGRDPALDKMISEQRRILSEGGEAAHKRELQDIVALQRKAAADLARGKEILSNIADDRELADSRAGRLEYKVRGSQ